MGSSIWSLILWAEKRIHSDLEFQHRHSLLLHFESLSKKQNKKRREKETEIAAMRRRISSENMTLSWT